MCNNSATYDPSVVDSGDRDPWPGWPAAWHVGRALEIVLCTPVFYARWHVGRALPSREREIGLTSPGGSVTHRLSTRRMQALPLL